MEAQELLSSRRFSWPDYLIFSLTLLISAFVGIYHCWRGAGDSTSNYLLGGKQMGIFPIAMSLAASAMSAVVMLAVPADVYLTGTMHAWMILAVALGITVASYVYLPIFHQLGIVSVNQYLELRFNRIIRRMSSFFYIFTQAFFLAILVYGPSLTLEQVTGIDAYVSVGITFVICTFYTSIGGIKAVVWTDTIQIFVMCSSFIALLVKGAMDAGIENVWQRNWNSSRIDFFEIDPDPTTRQTIWSVLIGGTFFWMSSFASSQAFVQRFLAMPTKRQAQRAMSVNVLAVAGVISLSCFTGLVAYARYYDCDPMKAKLVTKTDQIIPYFVMDTLGSLPGLPGLFVAGVFSAALSSLSSVLNAVALTILEDFIRPFVSNLEDATSTRIAKIISVVFGCISCGLVFAISRVRTILDATVSVNGAGLGALLGVFTLGMFIPWANSIGAGVGMVLAYVSVMWLGMSTQLAKSRGLIHEKQLKPVRVDGCPSRFNVTVDLSHDFGMEDNIEEAFVLLRLSYLWYTLIGMLIVLVVGTLVSFLTRPQDPGFLDPKLVCHCIKKRVGHKRRKSEVTLTESTPHLNG